MVNSCCASNCSHRKLYFYDNDKVKYMEAMIQYPTGEEKINIISHAIGFILSVVASVLLVIHAVLDGDVWHIVSFSIFGASLIILYAASTVYHSTEKPESRIRMKIIDHASIYVLIAGTYTPFTLVTLHGTLGWVIFGASWGLAFAGIILKLFFTGKYNLISTLMYLFMGWVIVFAIKSLINNLPSDGFLWVLAGGISYTIGAVMYSIKKLKFNHAIFHMFVLAGSFCHFIAVYFYVLP